MEEPEVISSVPPAMHATEGLADNVAGALAYVTVIPAILFLVLDAYNKRPFIRFHAFQSIGLALVWFAVSIIMIIPVLGWIIGFVGLLAVFCAWVLCVVKAYKGERFKLPLIGGYVENLAR
jgi:uncharacterized membrane protein